MAFWQIGQPLQAATIHWDGGASGSWTNSANWNTLLNNTGTDVALGSGNDLVFVTTAGATNFSQTIDTAAVVNSLVFNGSATSAITIAAGTGGTLAIGAGGITLDSGTGAHTISAPVTLSAAQSWTNDSASLFTVSGTVGGGANLLTVGGTGNTTISGIFSGTGGLTKTGNGTLTITADPSATGAVNVDAGVLDIALSGAAATDMTTVNVNNAGTLRVSGGGGLGGVTILTLATSATYDTRIDDTIAQLLGTGTVTNGGGTARTLTVTNTVNHTFDGVIQNGTAALGFTKSGTGVVTLTNSQTYTGTTSINQSRLILSGVNGRVAGNTINVGDNNGADEVLQLGGTGGADIIAGTLNRIDDTATITLNGGAMLDIQGPDSTSAGTTETVAALALTAGRNVISLTPDGGGTVQLTTGTFTRSASLGTALVRGTGLGGTGADTSRLVITTAPTGNNFVGTSTTAGALNLRIVPWLVGDSSATGAGSAFLTYDVNGLRPLTGSEVGTTIAGNSTNNVRLAGGETIDVTMQNFSINSMVLTGGTTTVNNSTPLHGALSVASGAVLFTGNATLAGTSKINFGGLNGVITSAANTTAITGQINSVLTGTAGVTFGSTGDVNNIVSLGGANLFSGGIRANNGILVVDNDLALGGTGALNAVTQSTGSTIRLNGRSAVVGSFTNVAGSVVENGAATAGRIRFHQTADTNFTGTMVNGTGGGVLNVVKTGANALTFNAGNSTFTGALVLSQGTVAASGNSGRLTGVSTISIGGGSTLRLTNTSGTSTSTDRLNNAVPITMRSGTFEFDNNAEANTSYSEAVGRLLLTAGSNTVIVDQAATGRSSVVTFSEGTTAADLVRTQGASVLFNPTTLLSAPAAAVARHRVVLTTAPVLNDGVIGGWAYANGGADCGQPALHRTAGWHCGLQHEPCGWFMVDLHQRSTRRGERHGSQHWSQYDGQHAEDHHESYRGRIEQHYDRCRLHVECGCRWPALYRHRHKCRLHFGNGQLDHPGRGHCFAGPCLPYEQRDRHPHCLSHHC